MKNILAIVGSASKGSSNHKLVSRIVETFPSDFNCSIIADLSEYPHFNPRLTDAVAPENIVRLREQVSHADGIIICTPEYIFSIPSALKNILEWCVSTTVFSEKHVALITASANGQKGHEELQLIMRTLGATLSDDTLLLIQGVKGKINHAGEITDNETVAALRKFNDAFINLISPR